MSAFMQIGNRLAAPIMCLLQKTPAQGAYCSVHVATAPELQDLRGGEYFLNSHVEKVSAAANNEATATVLWTISERLTGLTK
jgi:retinol dehydrogenase-12/retinol dehydrogenase-13